MTVLTLHRKLKNLLGERFAYLDEEWVLIEVLSDIDSLVLRRQADRGPSVVQRNSYGMATRRVTDTLTIPISDADTGTYSDEVLLLLSGRRRNKQRSTGT